MTHAQHTPQTTAPEDAATAEGSAYHYGVMRRAIDLIDAAADPLALDQIAAKWG